MVLVKGVLLHVALPLVVAAAGSGVLTVAQQADTTFRDMRASAVHVLHLDWQPEPLAPRSKGQVECWQRRDGSIRAEELATDYRGNIYIQDQATSQLRVLKLEPGFRLNSHSGDWMSNRLTNATVNANGTL